MHAKHTALAGMNIPGKIPISGEVGAGVELVRLCRKNLNIGENTTRGGMAVPYRSWQCPDCEGTFRMFHHPADEPPPRFCPLCGSNMSDEPQLAFLPSAPHVAKTIGRTADNVYRQMETASIANAEAAAEMTGGDKADFSGMKITNLQDYLRPGDVAAKMPTNEVAKHMAATGQGGFQPLNGMTGQDFAKATGQGIFPHTGETMRQELTLNHHQRARAVERAGQIARSK